MSVAEQLHSALALTVNRKGHLDSCGHRTCQQCQGPIVKGQKKAKYCSRTCRDRAAAVPLADRFWGYVDKTAGGCWLWTGHKHPRGYGVIGSGPPDKKLLRAHRVSWTMLRGLIPDGLEICHNCPDGDNPGCVNPDHLFLGTHQENMHDASMKGRMAWTNEKLLRLDPERRPRGERNTNAKLTDQAAREIKSLLAEGKLSLRAIGQRYGVSCKPILRIKQGRAWTHV